MSGSIDVRQHVKRRGFFLFFCSSFYRFDYNLKFVFTIYKSQPKLKKIIQVSLV